MIYLGSDHGGFEHKARIIEYLDKEGHSYADLGNTRLDKDDDYPDFAFLVAEQVGKEDDAGQAWDKRPKGILLCRSSGGMIVAANKVKNVRAVTVFDGKSARHAREHNDANIIAISGDWTDETEAIVIVKTFLETSFSNEERHRRRLEKISDYEKSHLS